MSVRDLIDAIDAGDAASIQANFEQEMSARISQRLDGARQELAKSMFNAPVDDASGTED